jgi:hypothetical protein
MLDLRIGSGESFGGTGLDANRRQKTSATRCSFDEKYV